MKFRLSRRQADVILNMRLQRLTGLERERLQADYDKVREEIDGHRAMLANPALVLDIIREDVHELRETYCAGGKDPRRTEISDQVVEVSTEDLVAVEPMAVTISRAGYLKRMKLSVYRRQRRGGRGVIGASMRESDFTERLAVCSTHDTLLFFSDLGRLYWRKVYELPLMGRTAAGRPIATTFSLRPDERITSLIAVAEFGEGTLAMATAGGRVKRTALGEFANPHKAGIIALRLAESDRLVGVELVGDEDELVLATAKGKAVRFAASDVRPMGRSSAGVAGVKLREGDEVVSLVRAEPGTELVTISANGFSKRTPADEYRLMRRGGQGVVNMSVSQRTGPVVACLAAGGEDELLVMTAGGLIVRTSVGGIRSMGRSVQGVRVMRPGEGDRVIAAARVPVEEDEPGDIGTEEDDENDEDVEEVEEENAEVEDVGDEDADEDIDEDIDENDEDAGEDDEADD